MWPMLVTHVLVWMYMLESQAMYEKGWLSNLLCMRQGSKRFALKNEDSLLTSHEALLHITTSMWAIWVQWVWDKVSHRLGSHDIQPLGERIVVLDHYQWNLRGHPWDTTSWLSYRDDLLIQCNFSSGHDQLAVLQRWPAIQVCGMAAINRFHCTTTKTIPLVSSSMLPYPSCLVPCNHTPRISLSEMMASQEYS